MSTAPSPDFPALHDRCVAAYAECDRIAELQKAAAAERDGAERAMQDAMEAAGMKSGQAYRGSLCTFTLARQWTVKVGDADAFKKWAVESGNSHVLYSQYSVPKIMELQDAGTALPEYVEVGSFTKLNHRRASVAV